MSRGREPGADGPCPLPQPLKGVKKPGRSPASSYFSFFLIWWHRLSSLCLFNTRSQAPAWERNFVAKLRLA